MPRKSPSGVVVPVPSLVAPVTVVVAIATPLLLTAAAATAASAIGIGCPIEGLDGSTTKKKRKKRISLSRPVKPLERILIPPKFAASARCSYVPRPPR